MKYKACLLLAAAAISTPSVHCIPNFKSVLNFLKPYERYGDIPALRHPSIEVTLQGETDQSNDPLCAEDLKNLSYNNEITIDGRSYKQSQQLSSQLTTENDNEIGFGFYLLQNDTDEKLLILVNSKGEIVDPEKEPENSNLCAAENTSSVLKHSNLFMTEEYHKSAQALKQQYEIDKLDAKALSWARYASKMKWTYEKVYHPIRSTAIKYAVVAGTCYLGWKLCKKIFGKTEKPAPAKAAKGKKVAARAVS